MLPLAHWVPRHKVVQGCDTRHNRITCAHSARDQPPTDKLHDQHMQPELHGAGRTDACCSEAGQVPHLLLSPHLNRMHRWGKGVG
jgi:hypothetical protein